MFNNNITAEKCQDFFKKRIFKRETRTDVLTVFVQFDEFGEWENE
jgi:hypothetical protein